MDGAEDEEAPVDDVSDEVPSPPEGLSVWLDCAEEAVLFVGVVLVSSLAELVPPAGATARDGAGAAGATLTLPTEDVPDDEDAAADEAAELVFAVSLALSELPLVLAAGADADEALVPPDSWA